MTKLNDKVICDGCGNAITGRAIKLKTPDESLDFHEEGFKCLHGYLHGERGVVDKSDKPKAEKSAEPAKAPVKAPENVVAPRMTPATQDARP